MINRPSVIAINDLPQLMDISPTIHPPPGLSFPIYAAPKIQQPAPKIIAPEITTPQMTAPKTAAPEFVVPDVPTQLVTATAPSIAPEFAISSINRTVNRDFVSTHRIRRYAQTLSPGKVTNTSKSSEVKLPTNIPTIL